MQQFSHPWYAQYEPGVPYEIPTIPYASLVELCDKACLQYANKPAFCNFGTVITYQQLNQYIQALAGFLYHMGLKKGDKVAVMMPNILQYPVSIMAILRAGLTVVNVNPQYTKPELLQELQDSEAKVIIVWDGAAHIVQKALEQLPHLKVITTQIGDLFPVVKNFAFQCVLKLRRKIPAWHIPNSSSFREALKKGANITLPVINVNQEDIAFLQYTGGTTGVPKGAMLTHHNILANLIQVAEWIKSKHKPHDNDIIFSPLPFYHIFSLLANCLLFIHLGGHNILITDPRDIPNFIRTMKKFRFQYVSGVNTLFNSLLQNPKFKEIDFSALKTALSGGMSLQQVVAEKWQSITGKPLLEGYGLTETSPAVSVMPMNAKKFNGSAGLPLPSTDVQIRDEAGSILELNQPGLLWVKGPQVMKGYWKQSEETKNVLDSQGWLNTGDIGKIDEQGYLYIVDRKKDMIKVSGFNVYPNEIEDVVAKMPGVAEVAALGVPDEHSGEVVKLFVVKKDPNLTEEAIRQYCRENLTGYKRPKEIEFRDSLPESSVGKVLRRALR